MRRSRRTRSVWSKLASMALALLMILQLVPVTALAADRTATGETEITIQVGETIFIGGDSLTGVSDCLKQTTKSQTEEVDTFTGKREWGYRYEAIKAGTVKFTRNVEWNRNWQDITFTVNIQSAGGETQQPETDPKPANSHTVSFMMNDGTDTVFKTQYVKNNQKATAPNPAPTREGYTFKGWNGQPDGTGNGLNKIKITKDRSVYAQWEKNAEPVAPDPTEPEQPTEPETGATDVAYPGTLAGTPGVANLGSSYKADSKTELAAENCLYTFKQNADGKWYAYRKGVVSSRGKDLVCLDVSNAARDNCPNAEYALNDNAELYFSITANADGTVTLDRDTTDRLGFDTVNHVFSGDPDDTRYSHITKNLKLYEYTKEGYVETQNPVDGKQYMIVAEGDDGAYALRGYPRYDGYEYKSPCSLKLDGKAQEPAPEVKPDPEAPVGPNQKVQLSVDGTNGYPLQKTIHEDGTWSGTQSGEVLCGGEVIATWIATPGTGSSVTGMNGGLFTFGESLQTGSDSFGSYDRFNLVWTGPQDDHDPNHRELNGRSGVTNDRDHQDQYVYDKGNGNYAIHTNAVSGATKGCLCFDPVNHTFRYTDYDGVGVMLYDANGKQHTGPLSLDDQYYIVGRGTDGKLYALDPDGNAVEFGTAGSDGYDITFYAEKVGGWQNDVAINGKNYDVKVYGTDKPTVTKDVYVDLYLPGNGADRPETKTYEIPAGVTGVTTGSGMVTDIAAYDVTAPTQVSGGISVDGTNAGLFTFGESLQTGSDSFGSYDRFNLVWTGPERDGEEGHRELNGRDGKVTNDRDHQDQYVYDKGDGNYAIHTNAVSGATKGCLCFDSVNHTFSYTDYDYVGVMLYGADGKQHTGPLSLNDQYYIVGRGTDGKLYALDPMGKAVEFGTTTSESTPGSVTFTAKKVGGYDPVTIGDTTYYVKVHGEVVPVDLYITPSVPNPTMTFTGVKGQSGVENGVSHNVPVAGETPDGYATYEVTDQVTTETVGGDTTSGGETVTQDLSACEFSFNKRLRDDGSEWGSITSKDGSICLMNERDNKAPCVPSSGKSEQRVDVTFGENGVAGLREEREHSYLTFDHVHKKFVTTKDRDATVVLFTKGAGGDEIPGYVHATQQDLEGTYEQDLGKGILIAAKDGDQWYVLNPSTRSTEQTVPVAKPVPSEPSQPAVITTHTHDVTFTGHQAGGPHDVVIGGIIYRVTVYPYEGETVIERTIPVHSNDVIEIPGLGENPTIVVDPNTNGTPYIQEPTKDPTTDGIKVSTNDTPTPDGKPVVVTVTDKDGNEIIVKITVTDGAYLAKRTVLFAEGLRYNLFVKPTEEQKNAVDQFGTAEAPTMYVKFVQHSGQTGQDMDAVTISTVNTTNQFHKAWFNNEEYWEFSYWLLPKEMNDTITATLYVSTDSSPILRTTTGEGVNEVETCEGGQPFGKVITGSMAKSLTWMKNHGKTQEEVNASIAALNFGTASQVLFDYDVAHPANGELAAGISDTVGNPFEGCYDTAIGTSAVGGNLMYTGQSLVFREDTRVRFYFKPTDGKKAADYRIEIANDPGHWDIEVRDDKNGEISVMVYGMNISEWDAEIQLNVYEKDGTDPILQVTGGIFSFCNAVIEADDKPELVQLCRALYDYQRAVKAFIPLTQQPEQK